MRLLGLMPRDRMQVGGVIGKAGTIVKQVREETGARIRVVEGIPNSDERVIVISAPNVAGRPTHAAQVTALLNRHVKVKCRPVRIAQLGHE